MAFLSAAQFTGVTDYLATIHYALKGSVTDVEGYGAGDVTQPLAGDWGASLAARQLENLIVGTPSVPGFGDFSEVSAWLTTVHNLQAIVPYKKLSPYANGAVVGILNQEATRAAISGVTDARTFALYYNTGAGGPYQALVAPAFAELWNLLFSSTLMDAVSIYAPLSGVVNMGQIAFGGSFAAGTSVNTSLYAGCGKAQVVVTGWTGTGGAIVVTGSARTAAGTISTGRTFTGTVANSPSGQTVGLAPGVAGDLLTAVSAISLPGGATGGTFVVQGTYPAGRSQPPS